MLPVADLQAVIVATGRLVAGARRLSARDGSVLTQLVHVAHDEVGDVLVAVPPGDLQRVGVRQGRRGIRVVAGGATTTKTLEALVASGTSPWVVSLDVADGPVTAEVVRAVVTSAREHGVAAAARRSIGAQYRPDGSFLAPPEGAVTPTTPVCFTRQDYLDACRGDVVPEEADPSPVGILARAGRRAAFVLVPSDDPESCAEAADVVPAESRDVVTLATVPLVGRDRGQITWSFDPRYGSGDTEPLERMVRRLVAMADLTDVETVVGIPEAGSIPAHVFAALTGRRLALASIWHADRPDVIAFREDHDATPIGVKRIYGLRAGERVLIVEDEVTSGRTVVNCVTALRAAGVIVDQVVTLFAVDHDEMRERLAGIGVAIHAAEWVDPRHVGGLWRPGADGTNGLPA